MTEQAAIQQVLNGNTDAFRQIVEAYSDKLFAFIGRIVRQPMDAEEIAEDVLVKAYQHLGEFHNDKATLWTWLCSIAYNESLNHLRKAKPTLLYLDDDSDKIELTTIGTLEETDDSYIFRYNEEQEPPLSPISAKLRTLTPARTRKNIKIRCEI